MMGGLLAGLSLACLAEVTDKSFRGPEDVGSRLNVPVLGHIPAEAAAGRTLDPMRRGLCHPDSRVADACRQVRTALCVRTRAGGGKVIQVTSPDPGDGATTLATNLAVSVAQSGRKVLLVDADFRSPRPDKAHGGSNGVGLSSLLHGTAATAEAVRPSAVEGLSVLPSGPAPANPAELLASPRLRALLAEVAGAYDLVLVDTPPLLAVSDPMVVAVEADEVLLTVRLARNGRPRAERAMEILEAAGARVLGVVVNGPEGGPRGGRTKGRGARHRNDTLLATSH
jgi:capsular exopolysaccharide synthesis family protein